MNYKIIQIIIFMKVIDESIENIFESLNPPFFYNIQFQLK